MKHVRFPSIEQLRTVVKKVSDRSEKANIKSPILHFNGTVKLHGTNAAVVRDLKSEKVYAQSRDRIIVPDDDNYGFARYVESNLTSFELMFDHLEGQMLFSAMDVSGARQLVIYGEWFGKGICAGVAVSELPKQFIIFKAALRFESENEDGTDRLHWFSEEQIKEMVGIRHQAKSIYGFPTYSITIDFSRPELSQAELVEITNQVEKECPVGKQLGVSGVGEGVVWTCTDTDAPIDVSDLIFKVKGTKHSDSNVKTLAPIDIEKANSIHDFVKSVLTDHRLEKMVEKLKEAKHAVEPKSTPQFLRLVMDDVIKEETDTMNASGLEQKETMNVLSREARTWFIAKCKAL